VHPARHRPLLAKGNVACFAISDETVLADG
jgi:hypothetical protein